MDEMDGMESRAEAESQRHNRKEPQRPPIKIGGGKEARIPWEIPPFKN